MTPVTCDTCGNLTTTPQRAMRFESIPYRRNGWVGGGWPAGPNGPAFDGFIPYEKKFKGVKESVVKVCGVCYAKECAQQARESGDPMNDLEQYLANLAKNETAPVVAETASRPENNAVATPTVSRRRNGRKADPDCESAILAESSACGECQAYLEIKTFRAWIQDGMRPIKGKGFRNGRYHLWCRHGVGAHRDESRGCGLTISCDATATDGLPCENATVRSKRGFPRCLEHQPPDTGQYTLDGAAVASRATERDTRPMAQGDLFDHARDAKALDDWTNAHS